MFPFILKNVLEKPDIVPWGTLVINKQFRARFSVLPFNSYSLAVIIKVLI